MKLQFKNMVGRIFCILSVLAITDSFWFLQNTKLIPTASAQTHTASIGALTDNAEIPAELRGYVQIAIDRGLFEAFPAEICQTCPGQSIAVPGPRFEPGTNVSTATLETKLIKYRSLFATGG